MSAWKPSVFGRFDQLEQLDVALPAVHAAPADLAFGGEPLAVVLRRSSQASRNVSAIFFVLPAGSFAHSAGLAAESMRTTPYLRMPRSRSFLPIAQALRTCVRNFLRSSSLPIAEPPPVGGHTGATSEPTTRSLRADLVGEPLEVVVGRVDADVRIEQEQVDAVELDAVDLRVRGQVEHRVEIDRRLGVRAAFADEARPHRVVKGGIFVRGRHVMIVCMLVFGESRSQRFGVRIAGTEVLQDDQRIGLAPVLDAHAVACAASAVTNSSSSVICPKRIIDGVETGSAAERAVALREDDAVGGGILDRDASASAAPSAPSPSTSRVP